jgi:CBS domain-containing protein
MVDAVRRTVQQQLVVTDDGYLVGVITRADVLPLSRTTIGNSMRQRGPTGVDRLAG